MPFVSRGLSPSRAVGLSGVRQRHGSPSLHPHVQRSLQPLWIEGMACRFSPDGGGGGGALSKMNTHPPPPAVHFWRNVLRGNHCTLSGALLSRMPACC